MTAIGGAAAATSSSGMPRVLRSPATTPETASVQRECSETKTTDVPEDGGELASTTSECSKGETVETVASCFAEERSSDDPARSDDHSVSLAADSAAAAASEVSPLTFNTAHTSEAVPVSESEAAPPGGEVLIDLEDGNDASARLREEGNVALRAGKLNEAFDLYSQALELTPDNHLVLSNRAAVLSKLQRFDEAAADARKCVALAPNFLKGYGRLTSALIRRHEWSEAVSTAEKGLFKAKRLGERESPTVTLLIDALQFARSQLLAKALNGFWQGRVSEEMGGYDQVLEFLDVAGDVNLIVTVMLLDVPSHYCIILPPVDMDADDLGLNKPTGMDVHPVHVDAQSACDEAALNNIFRLTYRTDPSSPVRVTFDAKDDPPQNACDWHLDLCAPFRDVSRPQEFSGPGLVTMPRIPGRPPRPTPSAEVLDLSFDEQLILYIKEILALEVPTRILSPERMLSVPNAPKCMSTALQLQEKLYEIAHRYPPKVAGVVEQLFADVQQVAAVRNLSEEFISSKRAEFEARLSETCRALLRDVRVHLDATGLNLLQFAPEATASVPDILSPTMPAMETDARRASEVAATAAEAGRDAAHCEKNSCCTRACLWVKENKATIASTAAVVGVAMVAGMLIQRYRVNSSRFCNRY